MNRSSSSTGIAFPLPGSPGSSWAMYRARFKAIFHGADTSVLIAFWLFGMPLQLAFVHDRFEEFGVAQLFLEFLV